MSYEFVLAEDQVDRKWLYGSQRSTKACRGLLDWRRRHSPAQRIEDYVPILGL